MRKKIMNKKGISPLVATILLIGFVVAIAVLVFLWGKNYIEELAEKRGLLAEKQQECLKVSLDVVKACAMGNKVELVIKNKANIPVHKFIFQAIGSETTGGDEQGELVERFGKEDILGSLETKTYKDLTFAMQSIDSVEIIPHLRVALGHYVPCSKQKIIAKPSAKYCSAG